MRALSVPIIVGVALLAVGAFVSGAHADDTLAELQKHVDNLRAQQQGTNQTDNKRIFDKARAQAEGMSQSLNQPASQAEVAPDAKLPRTHVRAKDGVPFPKPEEVILPPQPTMPPIVMTNDMAENFIVPVYKKPPRCDRPEARREESIFDDGNRDETTIGEILYLPEDLMPVDSMEVFGSKVQTFTYGPQSGDGVNIRMTLDKVPCVPYRIRLTNRARYYESGDFALKNYERDPSWRGNYHAWIQKKHFFGK